MHAARCSCLRATVLTGADVRLTQLFLDVERGTAKLTSLGLVDWARLSRMRDSMVTHAQIGLALLGLEVERTRAGMAMVVLIQQAFGTCLLLAVVADARIDKAAGADEVVASVA